MAALIEVVVSLGEIADVASVDRQYGEDVGDRSPDDGALPGTGALFPVAVDELAVRARGR